MPFDPDSDQYEVLKDLIKNLSKNDTPWDKIEQKIDSADFRQSLKFLSCPIVDKEQWIILVDSVRKVEERRKEYEYDVESNTLSDRDCSKVDLPKGEFSCWQLYRKRLLHEKNFSESSVDRIEAECFNILKHLKKETKDNPVKGMVVGSVQSGKTANMAGLIAMAADNGWNMFIVLTGTIDSLRIQTRDRLDDDLRSQESDVRFELLENPKKNDAQNLLSKMRLGESDGVAYLCVCLKNSSRLKDLYGWLNSDKNKRSLRILLIDDEADQASINTAKPDKERKAVNRWIVQMVNNTGRSGKKSSGAANYDYGAMNYVCYTATPYANFLSEGSEESLYPRNFITVLRPPNTYFGQTEIFGLPDQDWAPGLNIVSTEFSVDNEARAICRGSEQAQPGLVEALCWFVCCVGVQRFRGYTKPVSMLVHTSMRKDDHKKMAEATMARNNNAGIYVPENRNLGMFPILGEFLWVKNDLTQMYFRVYQTSIPTDPWYEADGKKVPKELLAQWLPSDDYKRLSGEYVAPPLICDKDGDIIFAQDEDGNVISTRSFYVNGKDHTFIAPNEFSVTAGDGTTIYYKATGKTTIKHKVSDTTRTYTVTYKKLTAEDGDFYTWYILLYSSQTNTCIDTRTVEVSPNAEASFTPEKSITVDGKKYTINKAFDKEFTHEYSNSNHTTYIYYDPEGYSNSSDVQTKTINIRYVNIADGSVLQSHTQEVTSEGDTTITFPDSFDQDGVHYLKVQGQASSISYNFYSPKITYTVYYYDENNTQFRTAVITREQVEEITVNDGTTVYTVIPGITRTVVNYTDNGVSTVVATEDATGEQIPEASTGSNANGDNTVSSTSGTNGTGTTGNGGTTANGNEDTQDTTIDGVQADDIQTPQSNIWLDSKADNSSTVKTTALLIIGLAAVAACIFATIMLIRRRKKGNR